MKGEKTVTDMRHHGHLRGLTNTAIEQDRILDDFDLQVHLQEAFFYILAINLLAKHLRDVEPATCSMCKEPHLRLLFTGLDRECRCLKEVLALGAFAYSLVSLSVSFSEWVKSTHLRNMRLIGVLPSPHLTAKAKHYTSNLHCIKVLSSAAAYISSVAMRKKEKKIK